FRTAMPLEPLNSWSASLTALGLAVLWQSALLAGLVAGVCLLRRASPAVRYWCWQILALKLLVMPLWTLALPLPGFLGSGPEAAPTPSASAAPQSGAGRGASPRAAAPRAPPPRGRPPPAAPPPP